MRVCAIDTSGPATSVGFADPHGLGPVVTVEGARRHAEVIDEVFAQRINRFDQTSTLISYVVRGGRLLRYSPRYLRMKILFLELLQLTK